MRKVEDTVGSESYILPKEFTNFRKSGETQEKWVRLYCNLTEAKSGLKILVKSADEEREAVGARWHSERKELKHIGEQLVDFTCLTTIPEACPLLYARVDMEFSLTAARNSDSIKKAKANLRRDLEEKKECQQQLQALQEKLAALASPGAGEKKRSRDAHASSDVLKERKKLRAKIADKTSDIATLDKMIGDSEDDVDAEIAALAPQQMELATLIGQLAVVGVPEEEQESITALLRQLDDATDRHDRTTSLLDQANMPPQLKIENDAIDGHVNFSAGPHSKQQLKTLLEEVNSQLSHAEKMILAYIDKSHSKGSGGEIRAGRFMPTWLHYPAERLTYSYAQSERPAPPADGQEDPAALAPEYRFSRLALQLREAVEETTEDLAEEEGEDRAIQEYGTMALPAANIDSDHDEDSDGASEDQDAASSNSPALISAKPPIHSLPASGTIPGSGTALDTASDAMALVLRDQEDRTDMTGELVLRDSLESALVAPLIDLPAVEGLRVRLLQNTPTVGTARLMLMAPPQSTAPATQSNAPASTRRTSEKSGSSKEKSRKTRHMEVRERPKEKSKDKKTSSSGKAAPKAAAPLLPEPSTRASTYHFGSDELDWEWKDMKVEFRVPPPATDLPEDGIDIDTLHDRKFLLMISDQAYEEPTPPPLSSSYTMGSDELRDKQTPPAQKNSAPDAANATGPQLNEKGRTATMPDMRSREPDSARPRRRSTAPQAGTSGAGRQPPRPPAHAPHTATRQHFRAEIPAYYPAYYPAAYPAFMPDPSVPWNAIGPITALPAEMRAAIVQAALSNTPWTSVWHADMRPGGNGLLKQYYVVRDYVPTPLHFSIPVAGLSRPYVYSVLPGSPFFHVIEIPCPQYTPGIPHAYAKPPLPSARRATNGLFTYGSSNPNSPRYIDPNRVNGAAQIKQESPFGVSSNNPNSPRYFNPNRAYNATRAPKKPPEPVRRPRVYVDPEPRYDEAFGNESRYARPTGQPYPSTREDGHREPRQGKHPGRTQKTPSAQEFWEERARHTRPKPSTRSGEKSRTRTSDNNRPGAASATRPTPAAATQETVSVGASDIEVTPIGAGQHAPVEVLGAALENEARIKARDEIVAKMRKNGRPVPRNIEQDVPVPNDELFKHIAKLQDRDDFRTTADYKDAQPSLARGKAIIDGLVAKGFDLAMLNDLHVDLSYWWNSGQGGNIRRPPGFVAPLEALCEKMMEQERRAEEYRNMPADKREDALAANRESILSNDKDAFSIYMRKKYENVFSFDVDADCIRPMMGRVFNKLNTYLVELAAKQIMNSPAFTAYSDEQRASLHLNLNLQKDGLDEGGVRRVPEFKAIFEKTVEDKLQALARTEPDKVANEAKRQAQRDNLRNSLLGSSKEGKQLHEDWLLGSEHGAALRATKNQLAANTWASTIAKLSTDIKAPS
ncbi:hypothetical protein [Herbaspirillum sp. alder98]|uniref:hypothetical protein n=1 Tax=Herbaspirillum sp. alder98 TaxID=2913096 RepID=UPI001CD865A4|nr:hypothetical protein [Herbaspirillum sp. alder98]MCA1324577.1 hypothetical protein [Herbaspirillum sp. alder98]